MGKYTYSHDAMPSRLTVWSVLMFVAVSIMAGAVFHTSQSAGEIESRIKEMNSALINERQSIRVLEAEWAYLTRPQRIEELVAIKSEKESAVKLVAAKRENVKKPEGAKPMGQARANEDVKGRVAEKTVLATSPVVVPVAAPVVDLDAASDVAVPVPARNARKMMSEVSQDKAQDIARKPDADASPRAVARQDIDVWPIQSPAQARARQGAQNAQAKLNNAGAKAPVMYKPASAHMQPVGVRMRPIIE